MASKNNNNDDNPQNTKHCVLIDGDFGRHELFSNIHPYTLNRLGKLNDNFIFKTYTEKALKLMNDSSNIQYHICYNSFSVEIDEYYKILKMIYPHSVWLHSSINTTTDKNHNADNYLQIKDVMSRHECDYIWIIHGIENHYEELIKQLKSNNNSKACISSYCWLENLKDGSNRIEYLVNNKINYQTEDRIERLSIQPILTESISIATKSMEQNKKSKTKIKCDFDGCEKQFKNMISLIAHELAEHSSTEPVANEEMRITTSASTTEKLKKTAKTLDLVCDFDGCRKPFKNFNALKDHQSAEHSSTQSVTNEETMISASTTEKPNKAAKTTRVVCDFNGCGKQFKNLNALKDHQLAKHSDDQPIINEEIRITTSASTTDKPKKAAKTLELVFDFDDCRKPFKNFNALKDHQSTEHSSTQSVTNEETMISASTTEKANKAAKTTRVACDFNGCGKQFTTLKGLKSHQYIAEHLITHSIGNEETITTTLLSTTDKPKKAGKTKKVICDFESCGKPFKNLNRLKKHQLAKHSGDQPVINEETTISASTTEKSQKTSQITKFICDLDACEKPFRNSSALKDHQSAEHSNTQSIINGETMISASTTENPNKAAKTTRVVCGFNGCEKQFKNLNALKDHQLAKYSDDQPVINEEKTTSVSTTEKPKKAAKKPKRECGFADCRLSFRTRRLLRIHRIETHPILLRCLFSEECLSSNERYLGMLDLQNHIILQHADSFRQRICPISECKNQKLWCDWSAALKHILKRHPQYILDDIASHIQTEPTTNISSWDLSGPFKCVYNACDRLYWEEEALRRHEAFEHPVALLCPFCLEWQQSPKKYIGLWNLRRHVTSNHAPLFSQPTCFDSECKLGEKKPFKSWSHVLRHILREHLETVRITSEAKTSPPTTKHKISKKCSYDTCNQLFKTRNAFLHHLITYHPYPLRCPYDSECNNIASGKVYLGSMELETHIKADHSVQFSEPMCFDGKCQQEKHYQDWDTVVDHVLREHLLDIK